MLAHEEDVGCRDEGSACMDFAEGCSNLEPDAKIVELAHPILDACLLDGKIT